MFRAFSPVNIPEGLSRTSPDAEEYQQTLCISVMCAESGLYSFSPAQSRRISAVRLPRGAGAIRQFPLGEHQDVNYRN